jgi:hypothetical protein
MLLSLAKRFPFAPITLLAHGLSNFEIERLAESADGSAANGATAGRSVIHDEHVCVTEMHFVHALSIPIFLLRRCPHNI